MAPGMGNRHVRAKDVPVTNPNQAASGTSGVKKRGRQRAQNKKLHDYLKRGGRKPHIELLPDMDRPIGPWATEWIAEVGILTRKWIPLNFHYWTDVTIGMKENVYKRLLESFDVDFSNAHIVESVESLMKKALRQFRAELHAHYKGLPNNVNKTLHPRNDVIQADWAMLCAYWESDEDFQECSEINTQSRECVEILHRGGSRPFARGVIEMVDLVTNQLDLISFYKKMHYNSEKGWTAPRAEENYVLMVEMRDQPVEGDSTPKSTEDIRVTVLGLRSNYTPGLGYGVVPPKRGARVSAVASATAATFGEISELRTREESAESELEHLKTQNEKLKEQQVAQQRQLDFIVAKMTGCTGPMVGSFITY